MQRHQPVQSRKESPMPLCVKVCTPIWSISIWLLAGWLLSGCLPGARATSASEPQLLDTLPTGWQPVEFGGGGLFGGQPTTWQPINIDGDGALEYLLFFTYDNGQVGAAIYDQQTGSASDIGTAPASAPNQPIGTYIPYQIEPSYSDGGRRGRFCSTSRHARQHYHV